MKNRWYLLFYLIFLSDLLYGGNYRQQADTIFNQIGEKGLKQGFWKKYYPDGKLKYRGQFLNDKPTGVFYRYYEKGPLQSIQSFKKNGDSYVKIYYQNGILAGEGKFKGTKKDSLWNYYSFYGGYLSYVESYQNGMKDGISRKYYESGAISQELSWKKDVKDGPWKIWFASGQCQLETNFSKGKLDGKFTTYFPDGDIEITGFYKNDKRINEWILVDPDTKKQKKIKYIDGVREDQDKIDKTFEEQMKKIEKSKGKIKDLPDGFKL